MKRQHPSQKAAPEDVLDQLLRVAHEQGALGPQGLPALSQALRERAEIILAERVATAEQRVQETAAAHDRLAEYHAAEVAGLRGELESLRAERDATVAGLRAEREAAAAAHDRLAEYHTAEVAGLRSELQSLRSEREAAVAAHIRLLDHHRAVLRDVLRLLQTGSSRLPWRALVVRRQLRDLARVLEKEIG
jgi:hypothetical protein